MTVYDIPNIEHSTVTPMANGRMFRIITNEGWVIWLPDYGENSYTTAVILQDTFDFSIVQILPISELPDGYEINGDTEGDHEVM